MFNGKPPEEVTGQDVFDELRGAREGIQALDMLGVSPTDLAAKVLKG